MSSIEENVKEITRIVNENIAERPKNINEDYFFTHSSLGIDKFNFTLYNHVLNDFYKNYSKIVEKNHDIHIIEYRAKLSHCQLVLDIDIKFNQNNSSSSNSKGMFYTQEWLKEITNIIQKTIKNFFSGNSEVNCMCLIFEKEPYLSGSDWKNGIHFQFPFLFLSNEDIKIIVDELDKVIMNNALMPLNSEPGSGLDKNASLKNGWLLYKSTKKPGQKPYILTKVLLDNPNLDEPYIQLKKDIDIIPIMEEEKYILYDEEEEMINLISRNNPMECLVRILSIKTKGRKITDISVEFKPKRQCPKPFQGFNDYDIDDLDDLEEFENNVYDIDVKDFEEFLIELQKLSKEYQTWIEVIFSIYNIFPNEREHRRLIHFFSKLCPKKYMETEVDKIIRGLKKNSKRNGYKFKNLFRLCKEHNLQDASKLLKDIYDKCRPSVDRVDLNLYLEKDSYNLKDEGYYFFDLLKEVNDINRQCMELQNLIEYLVPKINQVMCRLLQQQCWLIKNSSKEQTALVKQLENPNFIYKVIDNDGNFKIKTTKMRTLVEDYIYNYIRNYETFDFIPNPIINNPRVFNCWNGFKAKLLLKEEIDKSKIEIILYHLKEIWCDGNEILFDFLIGCYFKEFFTKPHIKTGIAINLVGEQGVGKTLIIDDFLIPFVIGDNISSSIIGLSKAVQKHNSVLINKIFCSVNELPSIDIGKKDGFDTLKSLITDTKLIVEPKNINPFEINNYIRFIFSTNNEMSLHIEIGDRRFFILKVSKKHKNDIEYFTKLSKTFNQDTANHFFSYCSYYETKLNPRIVPMTKLKEEMTITCSPTPIRFLYSLKELLAMEINEKIILDFINFNDNQTGLKQPEKLSVNPLEEKQLDIIYTDNPDYFITILQDIRFHIDDEKEYWVSSKTLFNWYNLFCEGENERPTTLVKFTRMIKEKDMINHRHSKKVNTMFNIFSIKKII